MIRRLGSGTSGSNVYLAKDKKTGQFVAVKIVDDFNDEELKDPSSAYNEIFIWEKLMKYKAYTDSFLYPIKIYSDKLDYFRVEIPHKIKFFFTMPVGSCDTSKIKLDDFRVILELLLGYLMVQITSGFTIGDVVSTNIILRRVIFSRVYIVNNHRFFVDSNFLLSFIDLSEATFESPPNIQDQNLDRNALIKILAKICKNDLHKKFLLNLIDKNHEEILSSIIPIFNVSSTYDFQKNYNHINI